MRSIWAPPSRASTANQMSMMGPKTRPIPPVPRFWMRNRAARMTTAISITQGRSAVVATPMPSTALSTEMAGVIMPSP